MLKAFAIQLPVLPEDLVGEILLRLPVRSLLQFKCVCKSWKTLISGFKFAKNHLRISIADRTMSNQQLVFFDKKLALNVSYPLKSLFKNPSTPVKGVTFRYKEEKLHYIIGSCNRLLCMLSYYPCCVGLYNPSLRFKSKVSLVPVLEEDWFIRHYGFGYDQVNDKYKVLLVIKRFCHSSPMLIKIYTFGQDDSWKTIPTSMYSDADRFGIFVNGTINWLVFNQNIFLSFDVEKETYMELLLPQNVGNNNKCAYRVMSLLSGCLCVSDYYDSENFDLVLWMMKEYGVVESWTKLIIIPEDKLLKNQPWLIKPLFISQNGILMVIMDDQLILYNSNNGVTLDPLIVMKLDFYPHIYCESLVSVPC